MTQRTVTKEEYDAFIAAYPNKPLSLDVAATFEPPLMTVNDFSTGKKWPDSVIAGAQIYEGYPKDGKYPYQWAPNQYFIVEND